MTRSSRARLSRLGDQQSLRDFLADSIPERVRPERWSRRDGTNFLFGSRLPEWRCSYPNAAIKVRLGETPKPALGTSALPISPLANLGFPYTRQGDALS